MGKGDKRRPGNSDKLINNWDTIFGKEKSTNTDTSDIEPFHISNAKTLIKGKLEWEEEQKKKKKK